MDTLQLILADNNFQLLLNQYREYVINKYDTAYKIFKTFKKQFDSTDESKLENFKPSLDLNVDKSELKQFIMGGYNRLLFRRFAEHLGYDYSKYKDDPKNSNVWNSFIFVQRYTWLWNEQDLYKYIGRIASDYMQEAAVDIASYIDKTSDIIPDKIKLNNPEFHMTYVTGTIQCSANILSDTTTFISTVIIKFHGGYNGRQRFRITIENTGDNIKV